MEKSKENRNEKSNTHPENMVAHVGEHKTKLDETWKAKTLEGDENGIQPFIL